MSGEGLIAEPRAVHQSVGHARLKELMHRGTEFLGCDVAIMGGANIAAQFLKLGLVDEISIHLVPVLFGSGIRLFEHLDSEHIPLETLEVIETKEAIHLRFRVIK